MAKAYIFLLLALATLSVLANDGRIIAQSPGSITFEVDENLQPVDGEFCLEDGEQMAKSLLPELTPQSMTEEDGKYYRAIATSFFNEKNLEYQGESPFYGTLIQAYAIHGSVTLSPDMIWLLISQGFARYVNAHAEELRPLLVSHTGKKKLTVIGVDDLFSWDTDWPKIIGDFASLIDQHTKGDIAHIITADFSTTGPVERVASQITLMESVESFFIYEYYSTCGIPSITLKGTPEDWQRVLEKAKKLSQYGLDGWVKELEPILVEFIRASEGRPNQRFWQSIVKKIRVDELRSSDGCIEEEPTMFDGWFLKLYPDEEGKTNGSVKMGESMPSEMVHVEFQYQGEAMELWAGFIATEVDSAANMLTPKIGWMVVKNSEILYIIKRYWNLIMCLTVLLVPILGFWGWKIIKSRRKSK